MTTGFARSEHAVKLRLALILPVAQVIIAGVLEFYAPSPDLEKPLPLVTQICWGVNAPALFVRGLGSRILDFVLPVGHAIPTNELCFLGGVALVWSLAGRALDRRIAGLPVAPLGRKGFVVLGSLLLLGLDLGMNALAMQMRLVGRTPWTLLVGAWAVILIVGSVRGLAARIRNSQPGNGTRTSYI